MKNPGVKFSETCYRQILSSNFNIQFGRNRKDTCSQGSNALTYNFFLLVNDFSPKRFSTIRYKNVLKGSVKKGLITTFSI